MGSHIATKKSLQRDKRPAGLSLQKSLPNIEVLRTVQTPQEAQSAGLEKYMSFDFDQQSPAVVTDHVKVMNSTNMEFPIPTSVSSPGLVDTVPGYKIPRLPE